MSKQLKLPTLLVVAENPTIRFWIKKHLDEQFFIVNAERRQEAIDALNMQLDFILVDAALEDCNALDLCKEMRGKAQLVPILLITGRLKKSYRDQAYQSGVTDFLSDQLDFDELEMRILAGMRAANAREKTVDLGLSIRGAKESGASLKNKLVLNDQGLKLLAEAKKENLPISFLFLRIDEFDDWENKEEVFSSLGSFIQNLLREKDVLIASTEGRYILLLWNTMPDAGRRIATRLREKIGNHTFSAMKTLTVSIAVSSLEASEQRFSKMIDAAVKSLKTHSETNLILSIDEENA